ncbi:MAG: dihydrolipoamide acetyltransferase [Nannocystaceae bacterium]|nr:dihydrolipoamide acetyltransferase [Nannocystaceae bacterium]
MIAVLRWCGSVIALALVFATARLSTAAPPPPPPATAKPKASAPAAPAPIKPTTTATPAKPAAAPAKPASAPAKPAAAAKPATTPRPAEPVADAGAQRQSEVYGDRIDGLQVEVDDLKDKIFRSKARLALLRETVLKGVMAGSRVVIAHRNLMGSGFRLVKMVYIMDGAQIYARSDESGGLDSEDEVVIYDGNLPPGPHNVTIELTYKGHGYGVFAYLSGYTFDSRSSHSFTAPENGAVKLTSVGFERGNMTTEMRDRPSVSWQELPLDAAGRPMPQTRTRRAKEGE